MTKTAGQKIAKATGIVMLLMLLSRILGFVRQQIMAAEFGRTYINDAYIAAFTIPDILYNLLVGGALSAAFIPVFSSYLAKEKEEEAWEVASTIINLTIILFVIGIGLGMIFTPYLMPLVASKLPPKAMALAIELTRIMFPAVLFTGLNGIFMGILNSYKSFFSPVLGSAVYNLGIIATGVALTSRYHIKGFAIGVIVGVLANFLVQIPTVRKRHPKYKLTLNLKHPGVKEIGKLMLPALIGLSVSQVNLVINQNFASFLEEGTITALTYANRLLFLPLGVFSFSIAMTIFPTLSSYVATGKMEEYRETFSIGFRSTIFITIPSAIAFMVIGEPIVRLLFEHGQWTADATAATAKILFFYSIGMFAQAALMVITRSFYAINDTKTPVYVGFASIFLNLILNWTLMKLMGGAGLALAFSLISIFNMTVLLILLRNKVERIQGKQLLTSFIKTALAGLVMALITFATAWGFAKVIGIQTLVLQGVQVLLALIIGGGGYFLMGIFLKMEETETVVGILKRKFGRKKAVA
jgi:putative peptidoglycan lipid II flippase